jgi:3-oxoacyl-[acyl-carrier protein] reductase
LIGSDFEAGAVAATLLGRIGQTDDVCSLAAFLASKDSKCPTGEHLVASGGYRENRSFSEGKIENGDRP